MDQEVFAELLEDPEPWPDFVVFGGAVNLTGLYSNIPIKCFWDEKLEAWLDEEGIFKISEMGLVKEPGRVIFSSSHKEDVENWILGVRATSLLLRDWAIFDCLNCGRPVAQNGKNLCIFCETTKKQGDIILKNKNEGPNDNPF